MSFSLRLLRALAATLLTVGVILWASPWAREAWAEPYMTVRENYKCSQCHVNKTGGGARTDYARVYTATRLAAGPGPDSLNPAALSDGAGFGRVSPYVSFGADLRSGVMYSDFDHDSPTFGMSRPAACESCHSATGGGGKLGEFVARMEAIPDVASIVYSVSAVPVMATQEFYAIMDKVLPAEGYVKVGTFRLPSGFQNTWDYPFQHADQGGYRAIVGLETVRANGGMEVGFEPGPFSFSVSVSSPDDTSAEPRGSRMVASGYALTRFGVVGALYATDPVATKVVRTTTEMQVGTCIGRITALGQIDNVETKDDNTGGSTKQQAWLGEFNWLVAKGHNARLLYEARDPDLDTSNDRRDRTSLIYEAFFTPWLQGRFGYRQYAGPIVDAPGEDKNGFQVFGDLHVVF